MVELPRETFGVCGGCPRLDWLGDGLCSRCWDKSEPVRRLWEKRGPEVVARQLSFW